MENRSCDSPSKCTWVPNAETPHIVRNVYVFNNKFFCLVK